MKPATMPSARPSSRLWDVLSLVFVLLNLLLVGIHVVLRVATARAQDRIERVQRERLELERELEQLAIEVQALKAQNGEGR